MSRSCFYVTVLSIIYLSAVSLNCQGAVLLFEDNFDDGRLDDWTAQLAAISSGQSNSGMYSVKVTHSATALLRKVMPIDVMQQYREITIKYKWFTAESWIVGTGVKFARFRGPSQEIHAELWWNESIGSEPRSIGGSVYGSESGGLYGRWNGSSYKPMYGSVQLYNRGRWMDIEIHYVLNTVSPSVDHDGSLEIKIDGNTVVQYTGIMRFRNTDTYYTQFYLPSNIGTSNGSNIHYIDDVEIWGGELSSNDDTIPPSDVSNEEKIEGDREVTLTWTNPNDVDYQGALVHYSVEPTAFPSTYQEGAFGCNKEGEPGASDGCTITGLENETQYNFSIFTYDTSGNYSQTVHISATPQVTGGGEEDQAWSANEQTGDLTWSDSGALWTARVLVQGSYLTTVAGTNMLALAFQGRNSGNYQVTRISIAEKDAGGAEGDVVDASWTKVPINGGTVATWESDVLTIAEGNEQLTDYVPFSLDTNKDYYVTFQLLNPSVYIYAPVGYRELYFDDGQMAAMAGTVDWGGTGYQTYDQRIHAVSKIYVRQGDLLPPKEFQLSQ